MKDVVTAEERLRFGSNLRHMRLDLIEELYDLIDYSELQIRTIKRRQKSYAQCLDILGGV